MLGSTLQHYRITRLVGQGGMGAVYAAADQLLERDVAIKLLHPELAREPELLERFRREAVTLAKLNHPHITTLYGLGQDQDRLFMVMELVAGESLDTLIGRVGRLSWPRVVEIALQVLSALDYAHNAGVIHRDLKPSNLLMTVEGDIKVMDFGIARVLGSSRQTKQGCLVGTLEYIAPEQIRGQEGDPRSDLYSLGVVLYELLTGQLPFSAQDEFGLMEAQLREPPLPLRQSLPEIPEALDQLVVQTLDKDPGARCQSAAELAERLDTIERPASGARRTRLASFTTGPGARGTRVRTSPGTTAAAATVASPSTRISWRRLSGSRYGLAAAVLTIAIAVAGTFGIFRAFESRQPVSPPAARPDSTPSVQTVARASEPMGHVPELPAQARVPLPPARTAPARRVEPPASQAPGPSRNRESRLPAETREPASIVREEEPVEEVASTPASEPAPAPMAPTAADVRFDRIKLLMLNGGTAKEIDAVLALESNGLRVIPENGQTRDILYGAITASTYSQSKHPRWRAGTAAVVAAGIFAAPVFFMKGTKHWLTVQVGEDLVILRLDKRNYQRVLAGLEARTGRSVERASDGSP